MIVSSGVVNQMVMFLLISFFLTLFGLFGRVCFGWFGGLSPIKYKVSDSHDMYTGFTIA